MSNIIDKARRHDLAISEKKKGGIMGARMAEDSDGMWVRLDDPVVAAMEEYIAASEDRYTGDFLRRVNAEGRFGEARAALLKLREDKP